jgi:peptidoglycan/xylan/chitin deacetylase (PgdA/CDA1 family)
MRAAFRRLVHGSLQALPLGIYPLLIRRPLIGIFYHSVADAPLPHVGHLYPPVSTARFEAALLYLQRRYHFVDYAELEAHRLQGAPLPRRAMHLSFDDGFAECSTLVRPLLLKHGIPCTFFVTTDWLDNAGMFYRNKVSLCIEKMRELPRDAAKMAFSSLNHALDLSLGSTADFERWIRTLVWEDQAVVNLAVKMLGIDVAYYLQEQRPYLTSVQVKQMAGEGFTIGSHTLSHPKLAQVDAAEAERQIVESSRIVQDLTGAERVPFSFPNSATGLDRGQLAGIRQRHPFLGLFFDTKGLHEDVDFIVNRIWAEKPTFSGVGRTTNVPHLLKAAYVEAAWEQLVGAKREKAEQGGEAP